MILKKVPALENYSKSNPIYSNNHSFHNDYRNSKKFNYLPFKSKYPFLVDFFNDLNKFNNLKTQKENSKKKITNVYDTASELYNDFLGIYFDEYNKLPDATENKMEPKYDPDNLFLKTYNYDVWFENEESTNTSRESNKEESDMSP